MEMDALGEDPGEAALKQAQTLVYGWPSVEQEATLPRNVGRFPKSFPVDFPMGIADLYDDRLWKVSPWEWAQHMLRYWTGHFVSKRREHRVVWAIVNTVLMHEAAGKGVAVHRSVMRRQGARLVGNSVLTRSGLREMMRNEDSARAILNQLMVVGKTVRSTSMQWSDESRKLNFTVKHLSWKPP
jgi:hypothetical protein